MITVNVLGWTVCELGLSCDSCHTEAIFPLTLLLFQVCPKLYSYCSFVVQYKQRTITLQTLLLFQSLSSSLTLSLSLSLTHTMSLGKEVKTSVFHSCLKNHHQGLVWDMNTETRKTWMCWKSSPEICAYWLVMHIITHIITII